MPHSKAYTPDFLVVGLDAVFLTGALALDDFVAEAFDPVAFDAVDFDAVVLLAEAFVPALEATDLAPDLTDGDLTGAFFTTVFFVVRVALLVDRDAVEVLDRTRMACPATTLSDRRPFRLLSRATETL